jgi:hypothetical protein
MRSERLRLVLFGLVVGLAGVAGAQHVPVGFDRLAMPLSGRAILEHSQSDGCSRSFASSHARATLDLRVEAGGAAYLSLDGRSDDVFTSREDGDSSQVFTLVRTELNGTARVRGPILELHFDTLRAGDITYSGSGTGAPPTLRPVPVSIDFACRIEPTDVFAAEWSRGETPMPERLLHCEPTSGALPSSFSSFVEPPLVFGSGEPVRTVWENGMIALSEGRVLRRIP